MRTISLLGLLALVLCMAFGHSVNDYVMVEKGKASEELMSTEWEKFKVEHKKEYETREEELYRQEVFKDNYQFIYSHNLKHFHPEEYPHQPYPTYYLGVNEYADLTNKEFSKRNGLKVQALEDFLEKVEILPQVDTNDSKDWVAEGVVTNVKNQGTCGSCWTFSACGAMESLNKIRRGGELLDLSEQMLVDCSRKSVNNGCQGGSMPLAFQHVQQYGIMDEQSYPYVGKQQTCQYRKSKVVLDIGGYVNVKQKSGVQLKLACDQNPVAVGIDSSGQAFQFYKSGIFNTNCGTKIDHAVLLVGYKAGKYYNVKNSWGASWGENGYIRMADNDPNGQGICGIQMWASYPKI